MLPGDSSWLKANGTFDISILEGKKGIFWRGCLDKYSLYAYQKEWRLCWLSKEKNYEAKILKAGRLDDIIDIVETKNIRKYLLKKYSGYIPGIVKSNRRIIRGTEGYAEFKERIKQIDGTGDIIMELG